MNPAPASFEQLDFDAATGDGNGCESPFAHGDVVGRNMDVFHDGETGENVFPGLCCLL